MPSASPFIRVPSTAACPNPSKPMFTEGKLFSPQRAASQLLTVVNGLTPEQSGKMFAWDGAEIPF